MDDLVEAFAKAGIENESISKVDLSQEDTSELQNGSTIEETINDKHDVDVYIAPEVLGHRWVRSRSTAYIVERPERLRASLLGLAAIIGKSYEPLSNSESIVEDEKVDNLTNSIASVSIARKFGQNRASIQALISRSKISLANPNKGLLSVHGCEEEMVTLDEIGDAPAYSIARQSKLWPKSNLSYLAYLQMLCRIAPDREPKVADVGHLTRQNVMSPSRKSNLSIEEEKGENSILLSDGSYPSEIPLHLPQGDLYLCGSQSLTNTTQEQITEHIDPQTPRHENGHFITHNAQDQSHIREYSAEMSDNSKMQSDREFLSEADLLRQGSQGAIEASLGACCTALDRIVQSSRGLNACTETSEITSVDLSELHLSRSPVSHSTPASIGRRAFVLARPPGHHCSSKNPSGFCWVNNVAVAAAEAYAKHGIDRIAILDFDLHHGDGTQSIVWRINEETFRMDADREARKNAILAEEKSKEKKHKSGTPNAKKQSVAKSESDLDSSTSNALGKDENLNQFDEDEDRWSTLLGRRGLKMFYGSLHDIESFPCEDGNKQKVTDASIRLEGGHGQWIWNVHLDCHGNRDEFLSAYERKYKDLVRKAQQFFENTQSTSKASMVIISAGFDACVHETPGMQRHGKNVPTEFYTLFTRDSIRLAENFCDGKLMSVLEGGYSDRALTTGVIAHLAGMTDQLEKGIEDELCSPTTLHQFDRLSKLSTNSMITLSKESIIHDNLINRKRSEWTSKDPQWLKYTLESFKRLQEYCGKQRKNESNGSATAPTTPKNDGSMHSLWQSPRETRSSRHAASAKPSPMK
ncbi:hypothetical protein L7F22_053869 [Adiantum nelumboides]|nr:hypothetical protein [Adiantum nelumboides]